MGVVKEVPVLLRADPSEEREAKLFDGGRAREGGRAEGLRPGLITLNPRQSYGTTHIVKSSAGSMQRLVALAPEVRIELSDDGFKAANAADQTPSLGRDVELVALKTGCSLRAGSNGCCRR